MCGLRSRRFVHGAGYKWRAHWETVGEVKALMHLRVQLRMMKVLWMIERY